MYINEKYYMSVQVITMRAKKEERAKARMMRHDGLAITEISRRLNVAKSSVFYWVRDMEIPVRRKERMITEGMRRGWMKHTKLIELNHHISRKKGEKRFGNMSSSKLKAAGVALFWGEGSKKSRYSLSVVNSDPRLLCVWIRFLREIMSVPVEKISARIYVYPDMDLNKVASYWRKELSLPEVCWRHVVVKKSTGGKRKSHYGTTNVGTHSVLLKQEVMGMIDGMSKV